MHKFAALFLAAATVIAPMSATAVSKEYLDSVAATAMKQGHAAYARGDYATAINRYGTAIVHSSVGHFEAYTCRGDSWYRYGLYHEKAAMGSPNNSKNLYSIAASDFAKAIADYQAALRIKPGYAKAQQGLSAALAAKARVERGSAPAPTRPSSPPRPSRSRR